MDSDAKKVIGIAQAYADEVGENAQTYTDEIAGNIVEVSVDPSSFLMTLTLKNKDGETLSTDTIDLPLEEMIVSGEYDSATKTLVLTLKSGQVINIPLADIISGLVTKDYVDGEIERVEGKIPTNLSDLTEDSTHRTVTDTEKSGWNNKVDKEDGKGLSANDFTDEDKNKLAGIEEGAEVSHDLITRRYEGVDLSVKFASEIATQGSIGAWLKWRCQQNKLDDLFPHDYFTITFKNGSILKAEIAGIDPYLHNGDTEITKHHIDFITKDCWSPTVQYNKVNYNNGIGLDKFTGDGAETTFQLTHRANGNFPTLSKVTVGGTEVSNYTYDATTGQLVFDEAPTGVIKAIWETAVQVPYLASNVYAYMNSLKMGVPNEAAADPELTEVDYTQDGIWYNMPDDLKAVIIEKRYFTGTRYTLGSLRTSDNSNAWVNLGKIWIPDEMEVYGHPVWGSYQWTYAFGRQYPCFRNGNRTKGAGNNGGRASWWLVPALAGGSTTACNVGNYGAANVYGASSACRVAFGFRISA